MGLDALEVFSFLSSSSVFNSKDSEKETVVVEEKRDGGLQSMGGER